MINEYYVYTYTDPRNGEVFYVGKGKRYRDTEHLRNVQNNTLVKSENKRKFIRIKEILDENLKPIIKREKTNLTNFEAYELEKSLIDKYLVLEDGGTLLNYFRSYKLTNKDKDLISESLKKYYSNNSEKGSWNKGKSWSENSKKIMSESRLKYLKNGGRSTNGLLLDWVTPYGVFKSYKDPIILEFGLTPKIVQKRCSEQCDKIITIQSACQIKDFDATQYIGKTWRELGWFTIKN